jgi:hypothetical protein
LCSVKLAYSSDLAKVAGVFPLVFRVFKTYRCSVVLISFSFLFLVSWCTVTVSREVDYAYGEVFWIATEKLWKRLEPTYVSKVGGWLDSGITHFWIPNMAIQTEKMEEYLIIIF